MIKYLFTTIFLFFSFTLAAQTTPIPDANFEQQLVDLGIDTNGINGNILDTDAQAVTTLNITRNDITVFTGLEAFTNLVTLNLGQNQFASLPLATLSVLEELEFSNNDALNSLDLTQNTALRVLDIGSRFSGFVPHPPITNLDLSQNINLETLDIFFFVNMSSLVLPVTNTLTEIDIYRLADPTLDFSDLDGLIDLRIRYSEVSTVITLPDEKTVIEEFEIQGITIPTIDVSEYTSLVDVTFGSTDVETLLLPPTGTLRSIDVQHHNLSDIPFSLALAPNLTDLKINYNDAIPLLVDISSNLELEDVDLAYNDMASVDISQNVKLTDLDVTGNELTLLNLTQNINLENLRAGYNQLPSLDLTQNTLLERATLSHNQLPILDITQNTLLTSLYIDNNLFTTTGLDLSQNTILMSLIANNNQIESLNITQNLELSYLDISFNLFPGVDILQQFGDLTIARNRLYGALIANNNLLSGPIPDFYSLYDPAIQTRRFRLHLSENRFHFGDLEDQHLDLLGLTTTMSLGPSPDWVIDQYTYAPQTKVNTIDNPIRNAGESITLTTTVRGTQNHYKWFKDGVEITDAPDAPEYTITDLNTCDAGVYHSEITSDLIPFENANPPGTDGRNLLLVRNDITLTVNATKACVTLDMPLTNVPINSGIQWNDNLGACGYKISVGTSSGATDLVNNLDVNNVTVYNHPTNFPPNQDIFVTITPYFDDGDFSGCSEQSFRTNATEVAPSCTSLVSSLAGQNNIALDANIEWEPANGADTYEILVGTTSGGTEIFTGNVGNTLLYDPISNFTAGSTIYVTIIPENTIGSASGCTEQSFTVQSGAPIAPVCTSLSSPTNGESNVNIATTQITWNAVANATGYRITITGTTNNNVTDVEVGTNSFILPGNFIYEDTAVVSIIPFNGSTDATGCFAESFTIESAPPPSLSCTTLNNPSNGDTNVTVGTTQMTWNAVANATGYRITITGTLNNNITNAEVTTNSYTFPGTFINSETANVTIIPFNATDDATGCSTETFTIEAGAAVTPACTTLNSPSNGDTNVVVGTSQMTWNAITNATGYRITITGTGNNNITNAEVTTNSYTFPGTFINSETANVTIIPFNATDDATGCSSESFTIEAATTVTPVCTTLNSPSNGDTNVAIGTTQMTWNAVTDATGYRITITGTANNNIVDAEVTTNSYTFPGTFINGETATVTIIPFNATDPATGCSSESFTIEAAAAVTPNCTTLNSPSNGDTNVAIGTTQMTWNAVTNATGYRIIITGTANNNIVDAEVTTNSYTFPGTFINGETATVTIIPFNATDEATGCSTESFTIENLMPETPDCTSLINPTNGDTNVEVNTNFSWNAITNATGYRISIGTTSRGTDIVNNQDVGLLTSYSLLENLPNNSTIYTTIIAYNGSTDAINCDEQSFTTIELTEDETKYGFSPNGDGINDYWIIDGIENYPDNEVYIYNRWGDIVFETKGYDNNSKVFHGSANKLSRLGANTLPSGTYFFNIKISGQHNLRKTKGYLVIQR